MIEFMTSMTGLDLLFVLIWVGATIYGFTTGIVRQIIVIACILISAVVSTWVSPLLATWTGQFAGVGTQRGIPLTYAGMYLILVLVMLLVSWRSYRQTRLAYSRTFDLIGGGILGFFAGLVAMTQLAAVVLIATEYPWGPLDGTREYLRYQLVSTPFLPLVADFFGPVTSSIRSWLPIEIEECPRCF
jgi:hypothetical protein